jgi:hypothetical protein
METKTVIDATIESLFPRTNEQIIVKSLFYSTGMNLSLREVQKALNFNNIRSVNKSIEALSHYRLTKQGFNESVLKADKAIYNFIQHKRTKNHIRHVGSVRNRLKVKYNVIIAKQK